MEAANRIRKGPRVFGDSGGHPWVGQLKEQSATRAQEDDGFSVDPPGQ